MIRSKYLEIALAFGLAATATSAAAQNLISTSDLKLACESSVDHTVQLSTSVKIDLGPAYPAAEEVATGCTILFTRDGSGIEFSKVAMRFGGPLIFSSSRKAEVYLGEASLEAGSVALDLYGRGSKVVFDKARVAARSGDFRLGFFEDSLFEVNGRFIGDPVQPSISAAGSFSLITDTSAFLFKSAAIQAGTGVSINLADEVAKMTMEETDLRTSGGSVAIFGRTRDIVLEINQGTLAAPNGVSITIDGRNSSLIAKQVNVLGGAGNVLLRGGSYSTKVELVGATVTTSSTLTIQAGAFGSSVLVEKSRVIGLAGVEIASGSQWASTVVKDTEGRSNVSFAIRAGSNSTCDASGNAIASPVVSVCR